MNGNEKNAVPTETRDPEMVDVYGDILYRINVYCLIGGLSDKDFRNNATPILEDLRAFLQFRGFYEIQAEQIGAQDDINDAARYRWLRDVHVGDEPHYVNLAHGPKEGLDSAIDAAIAKARGDA